MNLYPKSGMTWEAFAIALTAMEEFANTQGQEGFRFDVYYEGFGVLGLGAVTVKTPRGVSAESSPKRGEQE